MDLKTNFGDDFMFLNDKDKLIVGFFTYKNLQLLCQVPKIYLNGTFNSYPNSSDKFYLRPSFWVPS